jgi:hypothetical protein
MPIQQTLAECAEMQDRIDLWLERNPLYITNLGATRFNLELGEKLLFMSATLDRTVADNIYRIELLTAQPASEARH